MYFYFGKGEGGIKEDKGKQVNCMKNTGNSRKVVRAQKFPGKGPGHHQ
jgi:hypothetical protein